MAFRHQASKHRVSRTDSIGGHRGTTRERNVRRLRACATAIAVGMLLNVLSAWTFALTQTIHDLEMQAVQSIGLDDDQWCAVLIVARGRTIGIGQEDISMNIWDDQCADHFVYVGVPYWIRFDRPTEDDIDPRLEMTLGTQTHMACRAAGWPCLSMWCGFENDPFSPQDDAIAWKTGLHLGGIPVRKRADDSPTSLGDMRALPLRVVWSGFAVNTVFYASLVGLLLLGFVWLRRALRRRAGCCGACGYRLNLTATNASGHCPECGTPICGV